VTRFSSMNVRTAIKDFDANMLGIDLDTLEQERFRGRQHKELMATHQKRVEQFEAAKKMRDLDGHLNEIGEKWRAKEKLRRERISASKLGKEYNFPNELIQIAIRSLDARGGV
jgi:hypothetical protein